MHFFKFYIGCASGYHLYITYKAVYNLSFNSNCRILAAEPNYIFTKTLDYWKAHILILQFDTQKWGAPIPPVDTASVAAMNKMVYANRILYSLHFQVH